MTLQSRIPVVLDVDGAVGALDGELRIALSDRQEALRFGCSARQLDQLARDLAQLLPAVRRTGTTFIGSGDFHHLSVPLILRCARALHARTGQRLRVVVLDNHPDNMRFPFGVHCGSWVRQVAMDEAVSHVHVAGITSADISVAHCWENRLQPLRAGKLSYWSCGVDTHSYHNALKSAMREAPDVLMIGEIRDGETLTHAINYAQSGHLCISTLHGNNSYHALNRIISFFPLENRNALLMDLSAALKAVVSQRLIPAKDGKRRPALEVLINTTHIADLIRNGEIDKIKEAIEASMTEGAQTFEQSLFRLYKDGLISLEEALHNADSPTNLYWLINHDNSKPEASKPDDGESFAGFTLSH